MEINFKGPVMPVDPYSQMAFVEILNILLTAGHIVDVNRFLIKRMPIRYSARCQDISDGHSPTTTLPCGNGWNTTRRSASAGAYSASISGCWQAVTGKETIR